MPILEIITFSFLTLLAIISTIFLYIKRQAYPIRQKSNALQFIYICSFIFGQLILILDNNEEITNICQLYIHNIYDFNNFYQLTLWANFDFWIYITILIHYRLYILSKLEQINDSDLASFKFDGNYFKLSITNSSLLNKLLCNILIRDIVAVIILISLFVIKTMLAYSFKSIYIYENLDNEVFCLIFLHLIYLQEQVVDQFQSVYSLFIIYLIRLALETLSIGKWCSNFHYCIIYTIIILNIFIFTLQILLPLIKCNPKPQVIDGELIKCYFDECINHDFTREIYQEYIRFKSDDQKLQLTQDNIQEYNKKYKYSYFKTNSYKQLTKVLKQNQELHLVLKSLGLF